MSVAHLTAKCVSIIHGQKTSINDVVPPLRETFENDKTPGATYVQWKHISRGHKCNLADVSMWIVILLRVRVSCGIEYCNENTCR